MSDTTINFNSAISNIQNAVYGREVRQSIVDALTLVHDENLSYDDIKEEINDAKDAIDETTSDILLLKDAIMAIIGSPAFENSEWGFPSDAYNSISLATGDKNRTSHHAAMFTLTEINEGDYIFVSDKSYKFRIFVYDMSGSFFGVLPLSSSVSNAWTTDYRFSLNNLNDFNEDFGASATYPIKIRLEVRKGSDGSEDVTSDIKSSIYVYRAGRNNNSNT